MRDMKEGINKAIELQEEDIKIHGGTELSVRDKELIEHGYIQCALQIGTDIGMKNESFMIGLQEMVLRDATRKEEDAENQIYIILEKILEITPDEIKEIEDICNEQLNYSHPFKMATAEKQHKLGEYNKKVLDKLLALKNILEIGKKI